MGAPKQKWTAEEEAALKAGIVKHGAGKWRTILKDPEFSAVLFLRSNVDLKDKWRNMCVMPGGFGSRDRSRLALKRVPTLSVAIKQEENATSASDVAPSDEEMPDVKPVIAHTPTSTPTPSAPPPLQISSAPPPLEISSAPPPVHISSTPKRSIVRLDNLIMEGIITLKEHGGSNKTTIASYIEDQYWAPPDFKRVLSAKLKFLTSSGKLIKVKRKYQISPSLVFPEKSRSLSMIAHESRQLSLNMPKLGCEEISMLKSQIDLELAKMRSMTPQEAAAAAARAVAEAEAAMAEAEEAARDADEAEADAEAAQAFADAAAKMLRGRSTPKMQMMRT